MPDTHLCAHCAEPLPPHKGRGRPALTHPGDCRRKYRNAARLQGRVDRFLAATAPKPIDRSDGVIRGAMPVDRVDFTELHDADGTPAYSIVDPSRRIFLPREDFLRAMQTYEETQASLSALGRYVGEVDPALRRKVALIPEIPFDEYMAILRRRAGARMSPAFAYYAAHREELDAVRVEYMRQLMAAYDADQEKKAAKRAEHAHAQQLTAV